MKRIDIESIMDIKYVSDPSFSPDGASITFIVKEANEDGSGYNSNLYLLDSASGNIRALTTEGDVQKYTWTPEGTLLFPAMRDPDQKALEAKGEDITCFYELTPGKDEATLAFTLPLAKADMHLIEGDVFLIYASHDLKRPSLEGLSDAERECVLHEYMNKSYITLDEAPFWGNGKGWTNGKRDRMYIYVRSTGELTPITAPHFHSNDLHAGSNSFSIRGDRILYKGAFWEEGKLRPTYPGVHLYNWKTGENRTLLEQDVAFNSFIAFWDDNEVLIGMTDGKLGTLQVEEFYTLDLDSGETKLLANYEYTVNWLPVNTDARLGGGRGTKLADDVFYFLTTIEDGSYIYSISKDGTISKLLTPVGAAGAFDCKDGHIVVCAMYGDKLAELYLDGKQVTHFNDWYPEEYNIIHPEFFTFRAESDGEEIHCWVIKPADYRPGTKYPGILHIHGGPRTVFSDIYHHEMQVWANAGYYVFYCNPRGSDGRGNAFSDLAGKYATIDYTDIMQFTDEVVTRYPDLDGETMGVCGGSYGGYMTNWIIGHSDRFKAAVSMRSISSWISQEHLSDIGPNFMYREQNATTRDNVEKLWSNSPLKYAHNCKTATLFIHADQDYRCCLPEGLMMFTALQLVGCTSKMCLFPGENHELSRTGKPANRIKRMREILAWFDKYLVVTANQ